MPCEPVSAQRARRTRYTREARNYACMVFFWCFCISKFRQNFVALCYNLLFFWCEEALARKPAYACSEAQAEREASEAAGARVRCARAMTKCEARALRAYISAKRKASRDTCKQERKKQKNTYLTTTPEPGHHHPKGAGPPGARHRGAEGGKRQRRAGARARKRERGRLRG